MSTFSSKFYNGYFYTHDKSEEMLNMQNRSTCAHKLWCPVKDRYPS